MVSTFARCNRGRVTGLITALVACCGIAASAKGQVGIIAGPFNHNGRGYFLTSPTTWTMAEAKAVSMGGHLVTIETEAENEWLVATVLPHSPEGWAWIGLTDQGTEGTWVWVSGSGAGYRGWASGEPNNCTDVLGDEDFACFAGSLWADYPEDIANPCYQPNHSPLPGIIEVPCTGNPPPVNWTNAQGGNWDLASNWNPAGRPDPTAIATFGVDDSYIVTLPDHREIAGVVVSAGVVYFAFGTSQLGQPSVGCRPDFTLVTSPDTNSSSNLSVIGGWLNSEGFTSIAAGNSSTSSLSLASGGKMSATGDVYIGRGLDSTATLSLEAGEFMFASNLRVGAGTRAHGTVTLGNDGWLTGPRSSTRVYLGDAQGDGNVTTGVVNLNAGGLLRTGELVLGRRPSSTGRLYLNGGTLQVDSLVISDEGSGLMDWTGGTIDSLRSLVIGRGAGSDGQLTLDGAGRSLVFSGVGGVAAITVGDQGRGTLRVENGADISLSAGQLQGLRIGAHPSARGYVLVNGAESSIYGSADATTDSSLLVVGNAYGPDDGTLVVDNGGVVTFGHILCGSNIAAPGGGIIVRNHSYLTSRGLGDAFATPATGLRVGNAEGTAYMRVLAGGVVTANSAIFTGTYGSEPVVTVESADSTLDVKETLYLVDYGTSVVPELKVRGGGLLKTRDAYIGTGMGGASSSGIVTLEGPGIVWESTGTINVGDPEDVNAVGTLNLVYEAEVNTHRFHPGATTHITGGATGNPLIHVGSGQLIAADITCDTLLFDPGTNLGDYNLTYGLGAGIGGSGTWPGNFSASFGAEIVAAQAVPFPDPWQNHTDFTITGSLTMDSSSMLEVALGYLQWCPSECGTWDIGSRLIVQGTATIDGTLQIQQWDLPGYFDHLANRYRMIGWTYEALVASSVVGTFDQLVLAPDFVSNRAHLTYEPNRVLVTVDPPVCNLTITGQPVGGQSSPGGTMTLFTGATTEFGGLDYRWTWLNVRNDNQWEDVVDGMSNEVLSAAIISPGTIQVTVDPGYFYNGSPPLPSDLRLRCIVQAPMCNEGLYSDQAILIVCGPDVNHDGALDFFDYLDFVDAFSAGVPSADFNHDAVVDFFDYLDFVDAFSTGC